MVNYFRNLNVLERTANN